MRIRETRAARLADFFRRRPATWIDGRDLQPVAGSYGWRSRISDIRAAPYLMRIENRQRRLRGPAGPWIVSEYRYLPPAAAPVSDPPAVTEAGIEKTPADQARPLAATTDARPLLRLTE